MSYILRTSLKRSIYSLKQFRYTALRLKNTDAKETPTTDPDEPIKYSTSEAAKWKAIYTSSGMNYKDVPPSQSYAVAISVTIFMLYFCVFREENDLDDWMRSLETTIPIQVEELQLRAEIDAGHKKGINVSHLETRLNEIVEKRKKIQS